jgi:hypothetical protein
MSCLQVKFFKTKVRPELNYYDLTMINMKDFCGKIISLQENLWEI